MLAHSQHQIAAAFAAMADEGSPLLNVVCGERQFHLFGSRQVFQHLRFGYLSGKPMSDQRVSRSPEGGTGLQGYITPFLPNVQLLVAAGT